MPPSIQDRLRLARSGEWPLPVALEYYDLPSGFVKDLSGEVPGLFPRDGTVDRFLLEKALATRELAGLVWAGLGFGVESDSLREAMRKPPRTAVGTGAFPLDQFEQDGKYVLHIPLVEAWLRSWLPRYKVWSTLDGYARGLAQTLGVRLLPCAVSHQVGESPAVIATTRCVVSWDFVSLAHKEYLDNPKPITLTPDHVGWHVIHDGIVSREYLRSADLSRMQAYYEQHQKSSQPPAA